MLVYWFQLMDVEANDSNTYENTFHRTHIWNENR